jgi:hypothetical protein
MELIWVNRGKRSRLFAILSEESRESVTLNLNIRKTRAESGKFALTLDPVYLDKIP